TKELTLACLQSIFQQTGDISFEVIVLDNDSQDGSAKAIAAAFPQVKLLAHSENLGFAGGNNLAAKKGAGEYILLINPDTVVLDGAIQKLLRFAKANPAAGIWGGRTLFADKSLNPASCWRKPTLWEIFCRSFMLASLFPNSFVFNSGSYSGWDRSTIRQVDIVSGCFFLLKRELWEKLDGFSPEFFMYGEEVDLCLRAKKFGVKPLVTPDATIIHYGGASEKILADKMVRLLKAKRLLMKNHWSARKYGVGKFIFQMYPFSRMIVSKTLGLFKEKFSKNADVWVELWRRRKEWLA
ncbi:MAG TPA: glycosyltransferase family 2 protein, partial [Pyrinomonadaceae bacterium]|nr:glycosyltransferase family 2 protein [Pyrinomonadaceae bacterium]